MKPSREPSYTPKFIKTAFLILLVMLAVIVIAKLVAGFKLGILGL